MPKSQTVATKLANGDVDSRTYDANGNLVFEQIDFSDGHHEQKSFQLKGAAYTSTDCVFDARWRITGEVQYRADGSILDVMLRSYQDGTTTTLHKDANGSLRSKEVALANGQDIQTTYQIQNMPYVAQEVTLDAQWRIIKLVFTRADASVFASQTYGYFANGDVDVRYYNGSGIQYLEQVNHANGTHSQFTASAAAGYATLETDFDANWKLTRQIERAVSGAIVQTQSWATNALGTFTTTTSNGAGIVTRIDQQFADMRHQVTNFGILGKNYCETIQDFTAAWQMTAQKLLDATGKVLEADIFSYSPSGQQIFEQQDFADGHHVQTGSSSSGGFHFYEYDFNSSWKLTQMVQNNNDGTNSVTGFGNGLTLQATGLGHDIFTGGGTNEIFALGNAFGHEVIKDFISQGVGHDLITLSHSLASDWTHLLSDMHQVGANVVIGLNSTTDVTLQNMTVSHLTPADFSFV